MKRRFLLWDLKYFFKEIPSLGFIKAFKIFIWRIGHDFENWWPRYYTPEAAKFWKIIFTIILIIISVKILIQIINLIVITIADFLNKKNNWPTLSGNHKFGFFLEYIILGTTFFNPCGCCNYHYKSEYQDYLEYNYKIKTNKSKINLDPDKVLDDRQYIKFLKMIKAHMKYNKWYLIGIILWMTSSFWIGGFVITILKPTVDIMNILANFLGGMGFILWSTKGISLVVTFIIASFIHPKILKLILFKNKWLPFYEPILNKLGYHNHERQNALSVLAGSFLGRFIK